MSNLHQWAEDPQLERDEAQFLQAMAAGEAFHLDGRRASIRAEIMAQLIANGLPERFARPSSANSLSSIVIDATDVVGHLQLNNIRFDGSLTLHDCSFDKSAVIDFSECGFRSLHVVSCFMESDVRMDRMTIDGMLEISNTQILGTLRLGATSVRGELSLIGSKLISQETGMALDAYELHVGSNFYMTDGCIAVGETNLGAAVIGGQANFSGGMFMNAGNDEQPNATALEPAISADSIRVGHSCHFNESRSHGEVRLIGAEIGNDLEVNGAVFVADHANSRFGNALRADRARIGGSFIAAEGTQIAGALVLTGVRIAGQLNLRRLEIKSPFYPAVQLNRAEIVQSGLLDQEFECHGGLMLSGAKFGGRLTLENATLPTVGEGGHFIVHAERLRVEEDVVWRPQVVNGPCTFRFASVGTWDDDSESCRHPAILDGLVYRSMRSAIHVGSQGATVPVEERLQWLARDPDGFSHQPYAQLAGEYKASGFDQLARSVLEESEHRRRKSAGRGFLGSRTAWSLFLRSVAGYGYAPGRAFLWICALVALGWGIFLTPAVRAQARPTDGAPAFSPLLMSLDSTIPFLDFGYAKWILHGYALWANSFLISSGWILATVMLAAVTGHLRKAER